MEKKNDIDLTCDLSNSINNFELNIPTRVIYGKNVNKSIGKHISQDKHESILLLAGSGSIKKNGVYDTVIKSLKDNGISNITEVWGVRANPTLNFAIAAMKKGIESKCTAVLAVGGGSVLDTAKAVAAGIKYPDGPDKIWDAFEFCQNGSKGKPIKEHLTLYTVLTLSATASECNAGGVLTNEESLKKWPIFGIPPKISLVDPTVQFSLPWNQVANGASDALSHCLEHYCGCVVGVHEATMCILEGIMKTIIRTTDAIQVNKEDYNARANFCYCTTLALNGFQGVAVGGGDWGTHWAEHALSALYPNIAHGEGLAVLTGGWMKHVKSYNENTFLRWAKEVWGGNTIDEGIANMEAHFKKWQLPVRLSELKDIKIQESDIPKLAQITVKDSGIRGRPKQLFVEDYEAILRLSYK